MLHCIFFCPMTLLKESSSQDAQAQTWPGINQQVRFATMANESNANRDRLFEIVRDGSYAEAKKVMSDVIERAASIKVQSKEKKTPLSMLKALNHKAPQNKRKWASPTPTCVCAGAATRSRFAQWEWAQEESEPVMERSEDNVLLENQQYLSRQVSGLVWV